MVSPTWQGSWDVDPARLGWVGLSPGLLPSASWGPSPPYLECYSALFQEAKAATGVGAEWQAGRVGAGGGSRPLPRCGIHSQDLFFRCWGSWSDQWVFWSFVLVGFFFFLLRTIHFGLTTGVKWRVLRNLPIPLPWPQAVTFEALSPGATEDGIGAVQRAGLSLPLSPPRRCQPSPSPPPWQDRLGQPSIRDWTLSLSWRPLSLTALLSISEDGEGRGGQWVGGAGNGTPPFSS